MQYAVYLNKRSKRHFICATSNVLARSKRSQRVTEPSSLNDAVHALQRGRHLLGWKTS